MVDEGVDRRNVIGVVELVVVVVVVVLVVRGRENRKRCR